ncbi:MAG: hypothetical protein GKS01_18785 [Alphaproteobacteria bacterium]|nr:hypothetical protein [Alphaproteobacteria bacterium]
MKKTTSIATIAVIALSALAAQPTSAVVWNGSVNLDFTLGANWDGGIAPPEGGALSNLKVTINAGTPLAGLVTPGFFRIGDLDVSGAFHINGPGEVRVSRPTASTITGQFVAVNGGILSTEGGGQITLENSGEIHIATSGRLTTRGTPLLAAGIMGMTIKDSSILVTSGTGFTENLGQITQTGGTTLVQDSGVLANSGTLSDYLHQQGSVIIQDSGRLRTLGGGRYNISGGTLTVKNGGTFENAGTSSFTQTGGTSNFVNGNLDNVGTLNLNGGDLNFSQGSTITSSNGAVFNNTNGNLLVSGTGTSFVADGTFTQTGGTTVIADNAALRNDGNYIHNGGATNVRSGGTLTNNFGAMIQNGGTVTIETAGRLTNQDAFAGYAINGGTLDIQAGAVMDGAGITHLNGGTLRVDGQMTQQIGLNITGGTLQGTGTINNNVVNSGGTVGPGNSPGTMTIVGDYTQGSGGGLAMEVASLISFDILDILGSADLDGTLDLTVDAGYSLTAQDGDSFKIMNWNAFTGGFSVINGLSFGNYKSFEITYAADGLTLTVNVPAPGAMVIFALAVLTLMRQRAANVLPV